MQDLLVACELSVLPTDIHSEQLGTTVRSSIAGMPRRRVSQQPNMQALCEELQEMLRPEPQRVYGVLLAACVNN